MSPIDLLKALMLLHMPLTISEGLKVGSSTTSTISAPLGSSSSLCDILGIVDSGGGGGGGGGFISAGTEVTLFKARDDGAFALLRIGTEWETLSFVFSCSSSELRTDGDDDNVRS